VHQAALDYSQTHSAPRRLFDAGPSGFNPAQAQSPVAGVDFPSDCDTTGRDGKSSMLDGIGRKLMEREAKREGQLGVQLGILPLDCEAGGLPA
jgi:hypothetical protein